MIHPTAIIDPAAILAEGVEIGPYAIIEGPVILGPGCILHAMARIVGRVTMGARNTLHSTAVIGGPPQDRKYGGEPTEVIIGDDNIFREGVTVHRGTGPGTRTVLGSRNYLMVNSHVGHNCVVGDDVTLVNGSLLAGHVHIASRAIIGGNCAVHQFCRIGKMAMISNASCMNVDLPPYFTAMATNCVTQLNSVGLRRAGIPRENISAVREMFQLVWRGNRSIGEALKELSPQLQQVPQVQEVIAFCQATKRGVAKFRPWSNRSGGEGESE
jgi:UDP-N-acetylglucosamine acyltransferase